MRRLYRKLTSTSITGNWFSYYSTTTDCRGEIFAKPKHTFDDMRRLFIFNFPKSLFLCLMLHVQVPVAMRNDIPIQTSAHHNTSHLCVCVCSLPGCPPPHIWLFSLHTQKLNSRQRKNSKGLGTRLMCAARSPLFCHSL